jgi:hypothetical protein
MIPIREAIETGAWLKAEFAPTNSLEAEINNGEPLSFRFRVTEFSKIDLSVVDNCAALSCNLDNNIWKLRFDFVNLGKKEMSDTVIANRLVLADSDKYEFQVFDNPHLRYFSDYSVQSGLKDFWGVRLPPKIKKAGALPYELPDEFDQLYLAIRNGELCEV